jgi:hypothetical protein
MGSRSDNGGGWPSDGGSPDDLPDIPAEWGVIVIPDDLSELADEVAAVRAELRVTQPRGRWQRFTARPAVRRLHRVSVAALRAPALIISLAVLVTIASLFASAWPGPTRVPATQRTASTTDESAESLPALELIDTNGALVSLRAQLPAVILLTDGCECAAELTADTIAAVRPEITVVSVSGALSPSAAAGVPPTGATAHPPVKTNQPSAKTVQAQGKTVRQLRDPTGELRKSLRIAAPDGTAAAILVGRDGEIVRTLKRIASVEEFAPDLARLTA